jgi:hypothetical protein
MPTQLSRWEGGKRSAPPSQPERTFRSLRPLTGLVCCGDITSQILQDKRCFENDPSSPGGEDK